MIQEKQKGRDSLTLQIDTRNNDEVKLSLNSPPKSPKKRKNIIVLKEDEDPYVLELEEQIDQYERELIKRNESIISIQRNFESLSMISRTLKIDNEQLKQEMSKYKIKSDRYDDLEKNLSTSMSEYREQIKYLKENIHNLEQEDKNNKKQLLDMVKIKQRCQDLEKEIEQQSMKNKDQEFQIADLSLLAKASEKYLADIKIHKQNILELQNNHKELQLVNSKLQAQIASLQIKSDQQIQQNLKNKQLIQELTDQKNYLCSLEAKNTHILSKERKTIEESNEQIKKLEDKLNNQATLLYLKQSQQEEKDSKIRKQQALFSAKKEEIEQLQKLKKENEELKEKCICKKFPKLFTECQKLYENIMNEVDIEDFNINYEDEYTVVLQKDYQKIHNLIQVLSKNLNNYKKCFMKLNDKPQQLEQEISQLKDQIMYLDQILNDSQIEKQNLIDSIQQLTINQNPHKDISKMILRDVIYNNQNGVIKAQESEIQYLKGNITKLKNEIKLKEINFKNQSNQLEDLQDSMDVTKVMVQSLQKSKNIMPQIISFVQHCSQIEVLLQNSLVLVQKAEESIQIK